MEIRPETDPAAEEVQINDYRTPPYNIPHHVYIGRNDFHDDQENAIDLKGCRDIVISQNWVHNYEGLSQGTAGGYGTGIVIHHADDHAERVLVLYNEIWGCTSTGITVSHETDEIYLVGNVIHGNYFPGTDEHGPTSPWYPGVGIRIRNDGTTYVLGNLITDTHHGIVSTATPPSGLVVQGNVVANLHSGADGSHLTIESGDMANQALLDHNLYFQEGLEFTVRLGQSNDLHSLADLPAHAADCLDSDPLFTAPAQGDYRPTSASPTIDTGIPLDAMLQGIFAFTLDLDYDSAPRPQGAGWGPGDPSSADPTADPENPRRQQARSCDGQSNSPSSAPPPDFVFLLHVSLVRGSARCKMSRDSLVSLVLLRSSFWSRLRAYR